MNTPTVITSNDTLNMRTNHMLNDSISGYNSLVTELNILLKHNTYLQSRIQYLEDSLKDVLLNLN